MSCGKGCLYAFNYEIGRDGADIDQINLTRSFEKMGAEVNFFIDLDYDRVLKILSELKTKDFSKYSYVAVAFLTHGGEDRFVQIGAASTDIVQIQKDILIRLSSNETLNGKLKWLIMQTCQGSYDFMQDQSEGGGRIVKYPNYYLNFFASTNGTKAYRYDGMGSIFIHHLCAHLENDFRTKDLLEIFIDVSADTVRTAKEYNIIQKPQKATNLGSKKFYVTTGLRDT